MHYRNIVFDLGNTLIYQQVDHVVSLDMMALELLPGVRQALEDLSSEYILGLLSNTSRTSGQQVRIALDRMGIGHLFTAVITSIDVGVDKPDVRMFEAILKALCATKEETIMVGNDIGHDITPARSLGLTTVYFCPSADSPQFTLCDATFSTFDQLPRVIDSLQERY